MLTSLRESWRRKVAEGRFRGRMERRKRERRKEERRKEQLPFEGPERRRGRDRRRYVRRVMSGQASLPDEGGHSPRWE